MRPALGGLAALLSSALVYTNLEPGTPFFGTLVVLPPVLLALHEIGRWAGRHEGRRAPDKLALGEVTGLAVVVLLILGRRQLGLDPGGPILDRVLAAGLALLLLHRLAWLTLALRPRLGSSLPRHPPWPFFALPLVAYLAILPWTSFQHPPDGDEPHYLLLTHSLAYDFDTDLRNNYEQGDSTRFVPRRLEAQLGDPVGRNGELYSRHNLLLPLFLAPFYRVFGLLGALAGMAVLTAALGWLTLALAHFYVRDHPGETLAAWFVLVFTAPLLLFSYQAWVEVPAALLSVVALIQIHRLRQESSSNRGQWLGLSIALLLLPLLKIRFLLIAGPLAVLALWRAGRRHRLAVGAMLGLLLLLTAGILLFNQQIFHNPLKYHDIDGLRSLGMPAKSYMLGFTGLFFDCAFGLFANAPIWLLLLPALIVVLVRRSFLLTDFLIVFLPYLFLLSPRGEWFGAWSPPFRYGIVFLPLLALWLVPLLVSRRGGGARAIIAGLTLVSLGLTLLWLVEPGWSYNFAHGRNHLLDHLSTHMSADVARFFPSSTRDRAATMIWPPLITALGCGIWWSTRRRRGTGAWGVAVMLLLAAGLPLMARNRATRVIEFEDPWVWPGGGRVYPDAWVIYRPQYRGGWRLPSGDSIQVPVVAGGERVSIQVNVRADPAARGVGVLSLTSISGEVQDTAQIGPSTEWHSVVFEDVGWQAGQVLTLVYHGPRSRPHPEAILDSALLTWKSED